MRARLPAREASVYRCEHCRGTFARFTTPGVCPLCGIRAMVKCQGCGNVAAATEFIANGNRCRKCGSGVSVPGTSSSQSTPSTCKGCGRTIKSGDWTCPHCGHTQWGLITFTGLVGLFALAFLVAPESSGLARVIGGVIGIPVLLTVISEARTGWRARRSRSGSRTRSRTRSAHGGGRRAWSRRDWWPVAVMAAAVAPLVLGLIWLGQARTVDAEADRLGAAAASQEAARAAITAEAAEAHTAADGIEADSAAADAARAQDEARAAEIDTDLIAAEAAFRTENAPATAVAEALLEIEGHLWDIAEIERMISTDLSSVAGAYRDAVADGNLRKVPLMELAISNQGGEALAVLSGHIEECAAALEAAAQSLAVAAEMEIPDPDAGEAGDG